MFVCMHALSTGKMTNMIIFYLAYMKLEKQCLHLSNDLQKELMSGCNDKVKRCDLSPQITQYPHLTTPIIAFILYKFVFLNNMKL